MRRIWNYFAGIVVLMLVACAEENVLEPTDFIASSSDFVDDFLSSEALMSSSDNVALSSAELSSSSKTPISYGELVDERDGHVYKTVKIGEKTWMAENLNYAYLQPTSTLDSSSRCFMNDPDSCAKYGRYYLWSAAMDSAALFSRDAEGCGEVEVQERWFECGKLGFDGVRGVCPENWHIPSETEMEMLIDFVDESSDMLKSVYGWRDGKNGTDDFGFNLLPAGNSYHYNSEEATLWTALELSRISAGYLEVDYDEKKAYIAYPPKDFYSPVRCIQDKEPDFEQDVFTDERDGHVYKMVKIGKQIWMAENLNYAYLQPTSTLDSSSMCYDNDPKNCEEYGRLYLWSAAIDSAALFSEDGKGCGYGVHHYDGDHFYAGCYENVARRGVCPEHWHLPSYEEWESLAKYVNWSANALKSKSGWPDGGNGDDDYGFNVKPAGMVDDLEALYYTKRCEDESCGMGDFTYLWSSSVSDYCGFQAKTMYFSTNARDIRDGDFEKGFFLQFDFYEVGMTVFLSVRCIRDDSLSE